MPKDLNLNCIYQDLGYIVIGTYFQEFLFSAFPPVKGKTVLEPGCGCAKFSIAYAMQGCDVHAFDIDSVVVKYSSRLLAACEALTGENFKITLYRANFFEQMPQFDDSSFDLVFNEGVPHHFIDERRQQIIDEMARVAREKVIIIGNNGDNPEMVSRYQDVEFKYTGMPPRGRFFTFEELSACMTKAGLKRVHVRGIFHPEYSNINIGIEAWMRSADFIAGIGYKE